MGQSAFGLASGIGPATQTPFVHVLFHLRPTITSFLEQGIFEPVVNLIPTILAMRMFSIRLNHRTQTPILRPENGNWVS